MAHDLIGRTGLLKASGMGALAVAMASLTVPSTAMAQDHSWHHDQPAQGNGGGNGGGHAERQQQQQQPQPQRVQEPRPQPQPQQVQQRPQVQQQQRPQQQMYRGNPGAPERQQWNRNDQRGQQAPNWRDQQRRDNVAPDQRGDHRWDQNRGPQADQRGDRRPDQNVDRRWDQRDGQRWDQRDGQRWDQHGDRRVDNRDTRNWNRGWRNDNRYDWQRYRAQNRNVYRLGRYYSPYRNYSYRRLGVGFYLDSLFYGSNYWIADPWEYRLPAVYGPYHWVRYYDDALLVNVFTGQVVDVIYDFFW